MTITVLREADPRITAQPIPAAAAADIGRAIAAELGGKLPDGYFNTDAASAWFAVVNSAIHSGGIAEQMQVNDGGAAGWAVATRDPEKPRLMLLQALHAKFDAETTLPLLEQHACALADAMGLRLVRKKVEVVVTYEPVGDGHVTVQPLGGGGGPQEPL